MAVTILPERPDHPDAVALILELEEVLAPLYPAASRHGFSVDRLIAQGVDFVVLRSDGNPVGCGGLLFVDKEDGEPYAEVKRMYVRPCSRGAGHARAILDHLAARAMDRGVSILRLETGIHQVAAIRLYERWGFTRIDAFGPYVDDPLSRYYERRLAGR